MFLFIFSKLFQSCSVGFVQIDSAEQVKVMLKKKKGQDLQLKDDTGSIRICMWGEDTKQCKEILIGDVIRVNNVRIRRFYDNLSLNSTGFTRIHKVSASTCCRDLYALQMLC